MQKTQKENRLQGRKNESKPNVPSDAGRVPRGQSCCLLVRSVLWYVQLMDQQKHDTVRPGGREENKRKLLNLYFGKLALVESIGVEKAMVVLKNAIDKNQIDEIENSSLKLAHECRKSLDKSWGIRAWSKNRWHL